MIYSIDELRTVIAPIAIKYSLPAVYLFCSYARGTATEKSDIDLLIDTTGTEIKSLLSLAAVLCDLKEALGKEVDLPLVLFEPASAGDHRLTLGQPNFF